MNGAYRESGGRMRLWGVRGEGVGGNEHDINVDVSAFHREGVTEACMATLEAR